jgi:F-type H+-transporting ATPase subunit c
METKAIIAVAAALTIALTSIAPAVGQAVVGKAAMESIARQPEKAGDVRSTLVIAMALLEALAIYGLLIAFMLLSKI